MIKKNRKKIDANAIDDKFTTPGVFALCRYPDTPDAFDAFGRKKERKRDAKGKMRTTAGRYVNKGYWQRKNLFKQSSLENSQWTTEAVTCIGRISIDFDNTDQGLFPGQELNLQFQRTPREFYLLSPVLRPDAIIDIVDAKLHVR